MSHNKKHAFSLSTHQFRVRHLQGIQVKNLRSCSSTQLKLVNSHTKEIIYTSTPYRLSSNPQWNVDIKDTRALTDSSIILQIWDYRNEILIIEQFVTLAALCYLTEERKQKAFPGNTVLYILQDSFFYTTHGIYPDIGPNCALTEEEVKKPFCTVKQSDIRVSYDNNAVISLHSKFRNVTESRRILDRYKHEIHKFSIENKKDQIIKLKRHISSLQAQHSKNSKYLAKDIGKLENFKDKYEQKCDANDRVKATLAQTRDDLSHELYNIEWKLKYTAKSKRRLLKRRQTLLHQLNGVFPIQQDIIQGGVRICGVGIRREIVDRSAEDEIGPALGYAAHLTTLISSFLDVPLRFPLRPALSYSTVRDDIIEHLDDKRVLPLYLKGKDRTYISYGIFLLNRNIAQLHHMCGIKTEELKETLLNLQMLLSAKLGGSMNNSPPVRMLLNDRIVAEYKPKEPHHKTHKRVKSAPITFNVKQTLSAALQFLDDNKINIQAGSEVSSWTSDQSLGFGIGSMDKMTHAVSTASTSLDDVRLDIASPVDALDETEGLSEVKINGVVDGDDYTQDDGKEDDINEKQDIPIPNSNNDNTPIGEIASENFSHDSSEWEEGGGAGVTPTSVTPSPTPSPTPHTTRPTTTKASHNSSSFSSSLGNRSSFKSYIRAHDLWGKSDTLPPRSGSFKAYRNSSPHNLSETSDMHGTEGDLTQDNTDNNDVNLPVRGTQMNVCRARTVSNDQSIAKPVGVTQHFITKKYMALDSPIIVRVARDVAHDNARDVARDHHSSHNITHNCTIPESRDAVRTPISVDFCPVEELS